ncbi:hypothetical protein [Clostridium felsineum]|uniref:Uncharacterized protein n=1 Tax=Clostridium felsineum TaxID=36839 RepID=A0A1S8L8U8_9CLOT|nr:hypothetical protein [Clostridium felsineum]URZ09742.1 hypothetical protein CROST_004350 [Clostridium felsineum]
MWATERYKELITLGLNDKDACNKVSLELGHGENRWDVVKNYIYKNESLKYGFKELKFEQGFIAKIIYVKEVDIDQLDMAYNIEYKTIYKEREFIPWVIGKFILDT